MKILSVVGMKTSKNHRTTIISASGRSTPQFSQFASRFSKVAAIVMVTVMMVFLQVREYQLVVVARQHLTNFFSPVVYAVSLPFNWLSSVTDYLKSKEEVLIQNEQLKLQIAQLIRERDTHKKIANENLSLREALNVRVSLTENITTIRISHHIYDGYSTVFYSPTSELGHLSKNDIILTTKGFLVGRIFDAEQKYVKIMPITDSASRIPVKLETNSQQAVLAGDGSSGLRLIHVENPSGIRVGDRLVTSGASGIFPEGLPVAVVQSVGSTIKCTPLGQIHNQDFVLVLNKTDL